MRDFTRVLLSKGHNLASVYRRRETVNKNEFSAALYVAQRPSPAPYSLTGSTVALSRQIIIGILHARMHAPYRRHRREGLSFHCARFFTWGMSDQWRKVSLRGVARQKSDIRRKGRPELT